MSPSAYIVERETKRRGRVWHVRFRARREPTARHFATFTAKKAAENARAWCVLELSSGRVPDPEVYFAEPVKPRTLADIHADYAASRVDVGAKAQEQYAKAIARYGSARAWRPEAITVADVQAWINDLAKTLKPATIRAYLSVLRAVLDYADLPHPNPARDARVKLPRVTAEEGDPPSRAHFTLLLEHVAPKYADLLVFLEATGLRVDEALSMVTWGDVDWRDRLIRVRRGKTAASRRWVPLTDEALAVLERRPRDGATIFEGLTANGVRGAMRYAALGAGIPIYSPHDLRHRYTSLLVMAGVPAPLVGRIVGHRRVSVTVDTYSHVLLDESTDRLRALRAAAFTVPGAREAHVGDVPQEVD